MSIFDELEGEIEDAAEAAGLSVEEWTAKRLGRPSPAAERQKAAEAIRLRGEQLANEVLDNIAKAKAEEAAAARAAKVTASGRTLEELVDAALARTAKRD